MTTWPFTRHARRPNYGGAYGEHRTLCALRGGSNMDDTVVWARWAILGMRVVA